MITKKSTYYSKKKKFRNSSFIDTALIKASCFFREGVPLTTSHKSHDAGKYSGCGLLLAQIVLKQKITDCSRWYSDNREKFILGKEKGLSRLVQSIFAKTWSYPVELLLLKYRVKTLLSLLFLPAKVMLIRLSHIAS